MRHALLGAVLALFLAPALLAQDDKAKAKPGTPAEQLQALVEEQAKLQKSIPAVLKAAKTKEEQMQAVKGVMDKIMGFSTRYMELAKKHPKDPVAVDALIRVVAGRRPPELVVEALEILRKDHLRNEKLALVCEALGVGADANMEKFFREVLEKNPHAEAQAHAAQSLANNLMGRTFRPGITPEEIATLQQEAELLYDRIATKHADVKSKAGVLLITRAKTELHTLRNYVVGKTPPDIEGEDIDGKKFKLSDYRGKVVLLAFWAHWVPYCRELIPHERDLIKQLDGKPFVLVGVNSDKSRDEIRKAIEKEGIPWRSFWDGGDTQSPISKTWRVRGVPTFYVLDHQGVIRHKFEGLAKELIPAFDEAIHKRVAEAEKK